MPTAVIEYLDFVSLISITVTVDLYMEAETFPDRISRNVVAEIEGSKYPEQVITYWSSCVQQ